jgi:CRP-like cAMP-binding protein
MGASEFSAGISPLDEAHGRRLGGDREGALRLAVAILEAAPRQLGAASLVARLLVEADRPVVAGEAAARLVDAWVRRGDLPAAAAAAHLAERAGDDATALRALIAQAFGEGSPRLADVPPAPPPLPAKADVERRVQQAAGDALLDRAEDALQKLLAQDDPVPATSRVPQLPLFSALAPPDLRQLLAALEVRDVPMGGEVIAQGSDGHEAFVVVRGVLEVLRHGAGASSPVTLAALGPGAIFGEMALVSEAPRAASVLAVEPTQLLCVSKDALDALATRVPAVGRELGRFCRARMLSNLARHSPILCAVRPEDRTALMGRFETCAFEPGEVLVREGSEGEGIYLIASGGVEVMRSEPSGDRLRIAELGPGDVVGEISLVLRRPANADVVARHPTVALRLARERFQQAIEEHPGLLGQLYDLATRRDDETRSVVAQQAIDADDVVLL